MENEMIESKPTENELLESKFTENELLELKPAENSELKPVEIKRKIRIGKLKVKRTAEELREINRLNTKRIYELHKHEKTICSVCLGSYTYSNSYHHKQSDRHQAWLEKLKKDKETAEKEAADKEAADKEKEENKN